MIMAADESIQILMDRGGWAGDTSPRQALYIEFGKGRKADPAEDTITYHTMDDGLIAIDVDDEGRVRGIEIL